MVALVTGPLRFVTVSFHESFAPPGSGSTRPVNKPEPCVPRATALSGARSDVVPEPAFADAARVRATTVMESRPFIIKQRNCDAAD
jgi:hypothetical protein